MRCNDHESVSASDISCCTACLPVLANLARKLRHMLLLFAAPAAAACKVPASGPVVDASSIPPPDPAWLQARRTGRSTRFTACRQSLSLPRLPRRPSPRTPLTMPVRVARARTRRPHSSGRCRCRVRWSSARVAARCTRGSCPCAVLVPCLQRSAAASAQY